MEVIKMKIGDIIPYENNAKIHTPEQIEQIKKSILEFGNNDPIAIDKNNIIIEGHGRLLALQELGYEEVEVIKLEHLTEEQRKAYTLIHNKLTMNTDFDLDILMQELESIGSIDMGEYDFDLNIEELETEEAEEDNYEVEVPEEPKAKRGEVYQLGEHRLMCGDSTSATDVEKLMDGKLADLVVTDPPYNVAIGIEDIEEAKIRKRRTDGLKIENDKMDDTSFKEFLLSAFFNMSNSLKKGGAFYIWHASKEHINFESALVENGLTVKQQLIWAKNSLVMGRQDYQWKHEPCLYGWKDGDSHYFIDDRTQTTIFEDEKQDFARMKKTELVELLENIYSDKVSTTIIEEDKPSRSDLHPTMKPIKLIARQIKNSSRLNESVLDLFGGSGSTLIASEQLNRKCYMMEFDPRYVDVIINRWETLTGKKAVKIN